MASQELDKLWRNSGQTSGFESWEETGILWVQDDPLWWAESGNVCIKWRFEYFHFAVSLSGKTPFLIPLRPLLPVVVIKRFKILMWVTRTY